MIMMSGTVGNAVKLMEMQNQWMQKKASGQPLSKKEVEERKNWTQEQWMIQHFQEELERNKENEKMQGLMNKISSGQELTSEEIAYLEEKNPEALKEYEEIRAEQKSYEKKLDQCKTKEEVDRLKLTKMGEYLSAVRKIGSDPYIPKSAKLAIYQKILGKANAIEKVHQKFIRSGKYDALPTEEEIKEQKEAEAEEIKAQAEEIKEAAEERERVAEMMAAAENIVEEMLEEESSADGNMEALGTVVDEELSVDRNSVGGMVSGNASSENVSSKNAASVKEENMTDASYPKQSVPAKHDVAPKQTAAPKHDVAPASYEALKQAIVEIINDQIDVEGHKGRKINERA